jgi:hypothetical protein
MSNAFYRIVGVVTLGAVIAGVPTGCRILTEPSTLQDFQWIAVEQASQVTEGIDAAAFGDDIDLLGQLKTPTLCYKLNADFSQSGNDLTIHVDANPSDSPNCQKTPGGYRYTAALRGLGDGAYTIHVVHSVAGAGQTTFTDTATIH